MTAIPHALDVLLEDETKQAAFRVNDDGAAAWAIERLAEIRAEARLKESIAKEQLNRVAMWLEGELKTLVNRGAYFENLLADYARRQREDADRKTISLPHGKVSTRWSQPKFNINDEIFLPWATEFAPHLIRTKIEPSVTAMREHLVIQGNALIDPNLGVQVEGAVATSPELSTTIKTEGEKQ